MSNEPGRQRRLQTQRVSAVVLIVVLVVGAVLRARGKSVGLVLVEIAIALLIVGLILMLVRRNLKASQSTLTEVRTTMPVAYNCYYENGKRGIVGRQDGVLHMLRTKRGRPQELYAFPAGSYQIARSDVAITAARRVDGLLIRSIDAGPADGGVRIALSYDAMTLTGNMISGSPLDDAIGRLQGGA